MSEAFPQGAVPPARAPPQGAGVRNPCRVLGVIWKKVKGCLGVGVGLQRLAGGWGRALGVRGGAPGESGGEGGAPGGEAQPPEGVSDWCVSVNASECVRAGAGGVPRGAGVSLQPGSSLRPPCPARRALLPAPLAPPWRARRWDAPAEQAVAASWGALGSALPEGPEPSRPRSARPRRPRFPPDHALSNFVAAAAAAASGAAGRTGGRGAEPGRAGRGRRGARRAVAPARGPTMPQLGGGGGGGSGAGAAGGGDDLGANDELIPFQDEGGEEQEPSSDSASAQRDLDEVKSSLVNESENQSSSSDSEVRGLRRPTLWTPARRRLTRPRLCVSSAGGEAPAALSGRLPEAAGLFRRRYVLVRAAPVPGPRGAPSLSSGRPDSPRPRSPPGPGARVRALGPRVPVQGPRPRRSASPRLGLARSEKAPGRRVL